MQVFITVLFFYVFILAAAIMTWYVVRAFIKFLRAKKKEEANASDRDTQQ